MDLSYITVSLSRLSVSCVLDTIMFCLRFLFFEILQVTPEIGVKV